LAYDWKKRRAQELLSVAAALKKKNLKQGEIK
jgi:hypothetical protein